MGCKDEMKGEKETKRKKRERSKEEKRKREKKMSYHGYFIYYFKCYEIPYITAWVLCVANEPCATKKKELFSFVPQ